MMTQHDLLKEMKEIAIQKNTLHDMHTNTLPKKKKNTFSIKMYMKVSGQAKKIIS